MSPGVCVLYALYVQSNTGQVKADGSPIAAKGAWEHIKQFLVKFRSSRDDHLCGASQ
jgi:hypothetical protein